MSHFNFILRADPAVNATSAGAVGVAVTGITSSVPGLVPSTDSAAATSTTGGAASAATSAAAAPPSENPGNIVGVGCNAEQATFNNCAKNALFDYVSQTYYKSIADFCAPKKAKQIDLYTCICSTAQTIVQCYTVTCPVDGTNMNAFETYMTDNCLYLQTLQQTVQPTSAVVAIPARTGSGFTSGGPVLAIPSGAPSSGSLTGASGSSGASKNSGAKSAISASALTLGVAALFVF